MMQFRSDGTFTIVQFTDLHWRNNDERDRQTKRLMDQILQREQPDLIVFTGDIIESEFCENIHQSCRQAVESAMESGLPWAVVFGNHDSERADVDRGQMMDVYTSLPGCLAERGPEDIHGVGNYVLQLESPSGQPAYALYFFDSGEYAPGHVGGYEWIHFSQIRWYQDQSAALARANGHPLPALAFFHIPLPEYQVVWEMGSCDGRKFESVCCPRLNTGLFSAMKLQGDVLGVFVGHDHINDYAGELYGIKLCYGLKTGFNSYGHDDFRKGARIIKLQAGSPVFETWLSTVEA